MAERASGKRSPLVFVSYSSRDKAAVRRIVKRLSGDGVQTWFDELEIRVGESIHQKINEGLKKSDFFIVVLSQSSVKSRWVQEELSSASSMEKYEERGIFVLPLLLEECDVPPLLLDRRYANYREDPDAGYQELLDAIYHHFKTRHPEIDVDEIEPPEIDEAFRRKASGDPEAFSQLPPRLFEELVAKTFADLGFDVSLTARTKDGGYDIIALQPSPAGLGPQQYLVQVKRRNSPVGVGDIRQLAGVSTGPGRPRGVFVTSSTFTREAKEAATRLGVDLVDKNSLSQWLSQVAKEK